MSHGVLKTCLVPVNARMREVVSTRRLHVWGCPARPRRDMAVCRSRHGVRSRQSSSAPGWREEGRIGRLGCGWRAQGRHAHSERTGEDGETDHQIVPGASLRVALFLHSRQIALKAGRWRTSKYDGCRLRGRDGAATSGVGLVLANRRDSRQFHFHAPSLTNRASSVELN
jgi:hypothetical protein